MATTPDNSGSWENAPQGASLQTKMLINDASLQATNPNWPTGGTSQQIHQESSYNNNAESSKGAMGMAQVTPDTLAAIEKQTGRKLDPSNEDDALFIHRYVMNQNLEHFGSVNGALAGYNGGWNQNNWNNPETQNYVSTFNQNTGDKGWESAPQATPAATTVGTGAPQGFGSQDATPWESAPQKSGIMANLGGLGLQAANLVAGGVEAPIIGGAAAIGLGRRMLEGQGLGQALQGTVEQAGQNFQTFSPENALNKLGVNTQAVTQTPGYQVPAEALDALFNKAPEALATGAARTGELEAGMSPTQFNAQEAGVPSLKAGIQAAAIMGPAEEMVRGKLAPRPLDNAEDLASKLDEGPQATADASQDWNQALQESDMASERIRAEAAAQQEANLQPTVEENLQALREQAAGEQQGIVEDAQAALDSETGQMNLFQEPTAAKVQDFNDLVQSGHEFSQGDLFNELDQRRFDQYGPEEEPRALNADEFTQTLQSLSSQEGTRFAMPEDPADAYQKYLDTVSDEQGGLFDRPTIAQNFVKMANDAAIERYVDDHPVVKANQTALENAQLIMDQGKIDAAQKLLDTSRKNIGDFYKGGGGDTRFGSWYKDGIIHMNSGAPIPDWIKTGVMTMLKAFHGVASQIVEKAMYNLRNIRNAGDIINAGMRKAINDRQGAPVDAVVNEKPLDQIRKGPLGKADAIKEWVPDDRPYAEAKPELMQARDMDSSWVTKNISSQGGVWAAAISKSPVVKWAYTHIQNAIKAADLDSRRLLTNPDNGLKTLMSKMSIREMAEIHTRMDLDEGKIQRTDSELRQMGFNDKQRAYATRFRQVMDEVHQQFNDARTNAGLPPVDRRVAYMASRFTGDFQRLIYEKGTKRPIGFIGHNFRPALDAIQARLEELNPGKYDFEDIARPKGGQATGPNMFMGYLNVLNHFELNDPEMKAIMDTYREYFTNNATKALQALQHAKDKQGIMGAEGRKAWETQEKNAVDGMKSQLTYADHMIKWSHLQDAASKVGEMMQDPDLDQPNAKSYVQDYLNQTLGKNTSKWAQGISDFMTGIGERTGVGPSVWRGMNSMTKSALLQMWLGFFRIPHAMLTMTQFLQSNPAMAELVRSRGVGNFWRPDNFYNGLSSTMSMMRKSLDPGYQLKGFDKDIWDYQQKNQVFNANLTSHLTDITTGKMGMGFRHIMEANITYPEMAIRSSTFSIWAHTLKSAGLDTKTALGTAENLTRGALVDYRPSERPLVFGKLGLMGDIASTLTRFKMNQISQHQYFAKEAAGRNFTPMAALLMSSIAFAGVSGVMGFNVADKIYQGITEYVTKQPDTLKAVMLRNLPDWANYGLLAQLGINMQGSFSNADTIPDNGWAAMFPTGNTIKDMVTSAAEAAYYHDDTTMKKLLYNFSPTSVKGFEENNMFSKDTGGGNKLFVNPNTEKAQYVRTPAEQTIRDLAFHPIGEAHTRDTLQAAKEISDMYQNIRERDLKTLEHQMSQGTETPQDLQNFRQNWVAHRGDQSAASSIIEYMKNQQLTDAQRAQLAAANGGIEQKYQLQDIFKMQGARK